MGDLLTPVELRPMLQAVIDANPDAGPWSSITLPEAP